MSKLGIDWRRDWTLVQQAPAPALADRPLDGKLDPMRRNPRIESLFDCLRALRAACAHVGLRATRALAQ